MLFAVGFPVLSSSTKDASTPEAITESPLLTFANVTVRDACALARNADAAAIARDADSEGVKCMGDFWHMKEEPSDYAAFCAAGPKLQHVHIASRGRRKTPGEDGELDNYVDGFRGLKKIGYDKYVSFECGQAGDPKTVLSAAVELLRKQWDEA